MSDHNSSSEHVSSIGSSVSIWLALLVGTALTVGAAYVDLGAFNVVVALAIASIKATLVVLFFMHVKYTHERLTPVVIIAALFWLAILLALSMADYGTRLWT